MGRSNQPSCYVCSEAAKASVEVTRELSLSLGSYALLSLSVLQECKQARPLPQGGRDRRPIWPDTVPAAMKGSSRESYAVSGH